MLKINEQVEVKVLLLDDDGDPTTGTIAYVVYDEADVSFATGNMSAVSGVTGLYTMAFTPDASGEWTVKLSCTSPTRNAVKYFHVGKGVEQDSYNAIVVLSTALTTHDTAIKALLATVQTDLDSPNQYKADVTSLALEATLTAIKGGGWSTETLKVIKDAIDALTDASAADVWGYGTRTLTDPNSYKADVSSLALEATLGTHDSDIKTLVGSPASDLAADIAGIKTVVDAIAGYLDTEIADIKTETDKIPTILTDTADIQPRIPRIVSHMDFKSLPLQITLTSTAGDRGLVDIVVSGLPAGVTIIAVEGIFYCDTVENTFDGVNYLESTKIQVKEKTAGTDRDAIILEANKIFRFTDDMVRGGTVLTADWASAVDAGILAEVTGNATYQMWFDVGETVQNNIVLDGAVFMLRIWFSV